MLGHLLAVISGAAIGATLRWLAGVWLTPLTATAAWGFIPLGTLVANWLGAYCIGVAYALNHASSLFFTIGLLGSLTTLSSIALDANLLMQQQRYGHAAIGLLVQTIGAVMATWLGLLTTQSLR